MIYGPRSFLLLYVEQRMLNDDEPSAESLSSSRATVAVDTGPLMQDASFEVKERRSALLPSLAQIILNGFPGDAWHTPLFTIRADRGEFELAVGLPEKRKAALPGGATREADLPPHAKFMLFAPTTPPADGKQPPDENGIFRMDPAQEAPEYFVKKVLSVPQEI